MYAASDQAVSRLLQEPRDHAIVLLWSQGTRRIYEPPAGFEGGRGRRQHGILVRRQALNPAGGPPGQFRSVTQHVSLRRTGSIQQNSVVSLRMVEPPATRIVIREFDPLDHARGNVLTQHRPEADRTPPRAVVERERAALAEGLQEHERLAPRRGTQIHHILTGRYLEGARGEHRSRIHHVGGRESAAVVAERDPIGRRLEPEATWDFR